MEQGEVKEKEYTFLDIHLDELREIQETLYFEASQLGKTLTKYRGTLPQNISEDPSLTTVKGNIGNILNQIKEEIALLRSFRSEIEEII